MTDYACPRCAAPVDEGATACPSCGYVRPVIGGQRRPMPALTNQHAIASAVLATIGITIPFLCSIAAIVLAIKARATFKKNPALGGKTLTGIGLWLGIAGLAAWTYVAYRIATR